MQYQPKQFGIQLHVTERCNYHCSHCYQENNNLYEIDSVKLEDIIEQFIFLIKKWKLPRNRAILQITGGEPFIRQDFLLFLEKISKYFNYFTWLIMSNGSLIDDQIAKKLKTWKIRNFQLSIEGLEKTNDEIRGNGSFNKTLNSIDVLKRAKIPINISFTLSKKNQNEIEKLAEILAGLGISNLGIRRIAPIGTNGKQFKDLLLSPLEIKNIYQRIEKINMNMIEKDYFIRLVGGCENAIFNDEITSYKLMGKGICSIVTGELLTILPDGDVLLCRRCPIKIGNINAMTLEELYYSDEFDFYRKKKDLVIECNCCSNVNNCFGGAKCVTYALTKKTTPDIQCWKLFKSVTESLNYLKNPNYFKKLIFIIKNLLRTLKKLFLIFYFHVFWCQAKKAIK